MPLFYRNFNTKDDIVKQYVQNIFNEYKWNDKLDTTYQIFDFFYKNKKTIDLLYKANLQFFLVDNILINFNYKKMIQYYCLFKSNGCLFSIWFATKKLIKNNHCFL